MRRSLVPMLTLLTALATPLSAQAALSVGYAGTLGGRWQLEALEFGLVGRLALGPLRYGTAAVRAGWFGDQNTIISSTRGFLGALALALRTGGLHVAELGDDQTPTVLSVDLSLEASGYLAAHSPLPEGKRWLSLAALPALRIGPAQGSQFALAVGPAWFAGDVRRTHAFLAVRAEIPLARGRGAP